MAKKTAVRAQKASAAVSPSKKAAPKAKPVAQKPAPKAAPAKKAPAQPIAKPTAKKPTPAPKAPAPTPAAKPAPKPAPAALTPKYPMVRPTGSKPRTGTRKQFSKGAQAYTDEQLAIIKKDLLAQKELLKAHQTSMRADALTHSPDENSEEDGTNNFNRTDALTRAEDLNTRLHAIEGALRAVEAKTYGICQMCGCVIPRERLKAYPFAVRCVQCKDQWEKDLEADRRRQNANN